MRRRTHWMAAFVVTASCASNARPADPLGALYVTKDNGSNKQVDIAARLNAEGIAAYRAGKFADASSKFREAVARTAELPYFINLCMSLVRQDQLLDAKLACTAATNYQDATPDQRAHAQRLVTHIESEAHRRGINTFIPHGNPPAPEWENK